MLLGGIYPLLVYLGVRRFGAPAPGLGLLAMFVPAAISLGLLALFAQSLRPGRISLVGRFARAQSGLDWIPPFADAYCRRVTLVWCAFFVVNAILAVGLALFGPLAWWAAYTGLIAYVLAATLMGVEFLYRQRHVEPRVRRELVEAGLDTLSLPNGIGR